MSEAREYWDRASATFDDEPDHGLRDPIVRQAWAACLARWVPFVHGSILDVGCGTGSLTLLSAELGHQVTGIDASPAMVARATAKLAAGRHKAVFKVMDAAHPQLDPQRYSVILCRHLLWALPEPALVVRRWVQLLLPGGRLVLIEGFWHTGGGLHASQVVEILPPTLMGVTVEDLSAQPKLWGGPVSDERYAVTAQM